MSSSSRQLVLLDNKALSFFVHVSNYEIWRCESRQISALRALIQLVGMKKSKDVTNTKGNADTYGNMHQNQYGEAGIKNNKRLFMYPGLEGEVGRMGGRWRIDRPDSAVFILHATAHVLLVAADRAINHGPSFLYLQLITSTMTNK